MSYSLTRGNIRVSLVDCDEGLAGEYDASDPYDVPLWRMDVEYYAGNDQWEQFDRGSFCTLLDMNEVTYDDIQSVLRFAMGEIIHTLEHDNQSLKSTFGELSWLGSEPSLYKGVS